MLDSLFFTDETASHLSEYINSEKRRIMSAENPHALRKVLLYSSKIGAWCTVSRKWHVGALLFEETINDENYPISFTQIVALLKKERTVLLLSERWGESSYWKITTAFLYDFFGGRICQARYLAATIPTWLLSFCGGFLKERSAAINQQARRSLRITFRRLLPAVSSRFFEMFQTTHKKVDACHQEGRGRFQHLL